MASFAHSCRSVNLLLRIVQEMFFKSQRGTNNYEDKWKVILHFGLSQNWLVNVKLRLIAETDAKTRFSAR